MEQSSRFSISDYAADLTQLLESGHAKEHAYRPALKQLMSSLDDTIAVNDPKRSEHGNPDFVFLKESNRTIIRGYAEAKDIDVPLDKVETTEQLRRYHGYDNLFLTNYIDFRFFKNGEKYHSISIGELKGGRVEMHPERFAALESELQAFLEQPPENIKSGRRLAEIMGGKARRLRDNVRLHLVHHDDERNAELEKMFKMMRELLVHDLTPEKFADMYAQTLVYGLFVARYHDQTPDTFTRTEARDLVPPSNPFLREFFDHIVGPRFDTRLSYIVDELCEVFSVSDVETLVHKHLRSFESEDERDPVIHFYENFLKEYDPDERKKMGAYYTPLPVVRFIVREVDRILKKDFDLTEGLADTGKRTVTVNRGGKNKKVPMHRVQILDPAVGTATFLNETIKFIHRGFKDQQGRWPAYVKTDLLPRLYGFELMMAPYTIAHLKLGMTLQETGVDDWKQRLGVYLTNTLEEGLPVEQDLFSHFGLAEVVSEESRQAAVIKHEKPIMVVMGNPPYSGESSNKTSYAMSLVTKYKFEPGGLQKLQERNPKWINDDYVKFIAFAEDLIEKNGTGVVAMITNHSYLDNPTFRGMRWRLAKTFDQIHILDLHGNTLKKEAPPGGGKDENVFDIMQGVAILLAVKTGKKRSQPANVYHADLFGNRREKFDRLKKSIDWKQIKLDSKMFYFTDKSTLGKTEYEKGLALNQLFIISSVGIITGRDKLSVGFDRAQLWQRVNDFARLEPEEARTEYDLGADVRDWQVALAQRDVQSDLDESKLQLVSYRPFDVRWTYYTGHSRGFYCYPRHEVMQHFLKGENIGLDVCRQTISDGFSHVFAINKIADDSLVSNKSRERGYAIPLYLYHDDGTRTANFNPDVLKAFIANLKKNPEPEDVLDYIYAVLHSPTYRKKYREFLKIDFPRVPPPSGDAEFDKLVALGRELRELHLMTSPAANKLITTFPVAGSDTVERIAFESSVIPAPEPESSKGQRRGRKIPDQARDDNRGKVWINDTQYFGDVPKLAWNFYIGGYQPAQKWLKDRKGRRLSNDDLTHYQKIISVLVGTDRLMQAIDKTWQPE